VTWRRGAGAAGPPAAAAVAAPADPSDCMLRRQMLLERSCETVSFKTEMIDSLSQVLLSTV
jgi:hypothetical protein